MAKTGTDVVVLLHGLGGNRLLMLPLWIALKQEYSTVINWGYFSLHQPLDRHARKLAHVFRQIDERGAGRVHLVTHSMGGIIARLAMAHYLPRELGRFVMIAPPNQGSHVATYWAPWLGPVCPPLRELSDRDGSLVRRLPLPLGQEIGIVAAQTDILVRRASTHLACQTDHIVLPGWHTGLLFRQETICQTRHFLANGRFERRERPSKAA